MLGAGQDAVRNQLMHVCDAARQPAAAAAALHFKAFHTAPMSINCPLLAPLPANCSNRRWCWTAGRTS